MHPDHKQQMRQIARELTINRKLRHNMTHRCTRTPSTATNRPSSRSIRQRIHCPRSRRQSQCFSCLVKALPEHGTGVDRRCDKIGGV